MVIFLSLKRSEKPGKKYVVELETAAERRRRIHFGDSSMKDYTLFNAQEREARKQQYLARHSAREDWNDPETAGFWSRWILWGPHPSVTENLKFVRRKFNMN